MSDSVIPVRRVFRWYCELCALGRPQRDHTEALVCETVWHYISAAVVPLRATGDLDPLPIEEILEPEDVVLPRAGRFRCLSQDLRGCTRVESEQNVGVASERSDANFLVWSSSMRAESSAASLARRWARASAAPLARRRRVPVSSPFRLPTGFGVAGASFVGSRRPSTAPNSAPSYFG
jgi:hypothetical protein